MTVFRWSSVDLDFLDETCLDAAIHDLGVALDDIDRGGEIEGHRDAVIGLLQVLVQLEDRPLLDGRAVFQLFRGIEQDAALQERRPGIPPALSGW